MINTVAINDFPKNLICYGAADQCRAMRPIVQELGADYSVIVSDHVSDSAPYADVELIQGFAALEKWLSGRKPSECGFMIAIGNPYGFVRVRLHHQLTALGCRPVTIVAKSADVDRTAKMGAGCQIMRHATICAEACLGVQVILNTKSSIDHDCICDAGVEILPGAILCGRVHVKPYGTVCCNASVGPRVTIGSNAMVGAGAVVIRDIPEDCVYVGNPARFLKKNPITDRLCAMHAENNLGNGGSSHGA